MRAIWVALVLAAVAGCATGTGHRQEGGWLPSMRPLPNDTERMLGFYERVLKLKGDDLVREYETITQAYDKEPGELNRLQLATLLSLPSTGFRDEAAALNLVQPFVRDKRYQDSALRPLALLMQAYLTELRREEEALQLQMSRLKDEQRRADALQQKLEALLDMEMKMIEHEQSVPTRKR